MGRLRPRPASPSMRMWHVACREGFLSSQRQHSFVARKQLAKHTLTPLCDFSGRRIFFLRDIPICLRRAPVRTRIRSRATAHARGETRSLRTANVLVGPMFCHEAANSEQQFWEAIP